MDIASGYDRTLIDLNQHIRSVCRQCGAVIVGSVLDGFAELETTHRDLCSRSDASLSFAKSKASHAC